MNTQSGPTPQRHNARCVIWRAHDALVPTELRTALLKRRLWFTECDTASWAIAEVCKLNHVDSSTPVILLLLSPKDLVNVEAVLSVCERYAPHATHWMYNDSSDPKLQTLMNIGPGQHISKPVPITTLIDAEIETDSDIPCSGCKDGEESPSILSRDELASLKHPEQAGDTQT